MQGISGVLMDPLNTTVKPDFPTRLEHSYFNDNVYWSLAPPIINELDSMPNTMIHPRISWKISKPSTVLPVISDAATSERKWIWPTTTSGFTGTFPFEHLTHGYDSGEEVEGNVILCIAQ